MFLNNLIDTDLQQNGRWLLEAGKPLKQAFDKFLDFVDETIQQIGFFESLQSIEDYISAVEMGRWAFVTVAPLYLYALIAVGQISKAKDLALRHRALQVEAAKDRGFVLRESDTRPYDEILKLPA